MSTGNVQHIFLTSPLSPLFLLVLGRNTVILILPACGVREFQALAGYHVGFLCVLIGYVSDIYFLGHLPFAAKQLTQPLFWGRFAI